MTRLRGQTGSVALEAVLVAPLVALLATAVLGLTGVVADQLVAERAARAGARAVALTGGAGGVTAGLPAHARLTVTRSGRIATVRVTIPGDVVGLPYIASATASAPLEPVVVP